MLFGFISLPLASWASQITKSAPSHAIVKGKLGEFGSGDYVEFRNQAGHRTGVGKAYRTTGRNTYFEIFSGAAPKGTRPYRTEDLNRIYGPGAYRDPASAKENEKQIRRNAFSLMIFGGYYKSRRNFLNLLPSDQQKQQDGLAYGLNIRIGKSRKQGGMALRLGAKMGSTPFPVTEQDTELKFLSYSGGIEYVFNLGERAKLGLGGLFDYSTYESSEGTSGIQRLLTPFANLIFILNRTIHWGFEYQKPVTIFEGFEPLDEDIISTIIEFEF